MAQEREEEPQANPDFQIIGQGTIGDKAEQLRLKTPTLKSLGFRVPPRIVLAQGFFNSFFKSNGLGNSLLDTSPSTDIQAVILKGTFPSGCMASLEVATAGLGNRPLVVRSSAQGDARGTGVYTSVFTDSQLRYVARAVQKVLASYFSAGAVAFRRDAQTGEGFGVMIEPLIADNMGGRYPIYAPLLSGFGYTSTSRGEGFINVVPGIGGGVETRDGERITERVIAEYRGSLYDYIDELELRITAEVMSPKRSALLDTAGTGKSHVGGFFDGNAYFPSRKPGTNGQLTQADVGLVDPETGRDSMQDVNLLPLFAMMRSMEASFGRPQYFEWAMTLNERTPLFWIIQIADTDKKLDLMDFGNHGEPLFTGHSVRGTGVRQCTQLVMCHNPPDIAALRRFNERNAGYALIYPSKLTTYRPGDYQRLQYTDYDHASIFLELPGARHLGSPESHLEGMLAATDKFFAILDYDSDPPPNWEKYNAKAEREQTFQVYTGNITVVSSERQNRLVIYTQDDEEPEEKP